MQPLSWSATFAACRSVGVDSSQGVTRSWDSVAASLDSTDDVLGAILSLAIENTEVKRKHQMKKMPETPLSLETNGRSEKKGSHDLSEIHRGDFWILRRENPASRYQAASGESQEHSNRKLDLDNQRNGIQSSWRAAGTGTPSAQCFKHREILSAAVRHDQCAYRLMSFLIKTRQLLRKTLLTSEEWIMHSCSN